MLYTVFGNVSIQITHYGMGSFTNPIQVNSKQILRPITSFDSFFKFYKTINNSVLPDF